MLYIEPLNYINAQLLTFTSLPITGYVNNLRSMTFYSNRETILITHHKYMGVVAYFIALVIYLHFVYEPKPSG